MTECKTVHELTVALGAAADWWNDPLAILYDRGGDVKYSVTVLGRHACDKDCDEDCSLKGHVVLDIDQRGCLS